MATCKEIKREFRTAAREEREARGKVRELNARVVAETKKLTWRSADTERDAVKPLVAEAQAASNKWWAAADRLSNAQAHLATRCPRK